MATAEIPTNRFYILSPTSLGISLPVLQSSDPAAMSATAIISTPTPDRVGDSLVPSGCQLDAYRKNPVVLWNHGLEHSLPIGKSEDPEGRLTVWIVASHIFATCYFAQSSLEAQQVFSLVEEGIIRAASVRARPLRSSEKHLDGERVFVMDEWELEEWSWCSVAMNPEAVRAVVSKNSLAGRQICEPLLRSLKSVASLGRARGRGWSAPEKSEPLLMDAEPGGTDIDDEVERAKDALDDETEPFGRRFLRAEAMGLADLRDQAETARELLENDAVREATAEADGLLEKALQIYLNCYRAQYGGDLGLNIKAPPAESHKALERFLAANREPRLAMVDVDRQLRSLACAANIRPRQRQKLAGVFKSLGKIVAASRQYDGTPDDSAALREIQAMRDGLRDTLDDLKAIFPYDPARGW